MEEMLSRVLLPILRRAIDELSADSENDGQEKDGQKLGMNKNLTRPIKSMKGEYAKAVEDGKATALDRFQDAYKFRAQEFFASARYTSVYEQGEQTRWKHSLHCLQNAEYMGVLQKRYSTKTREQ